MNKSLFKSYYGHKKLAQIDWPKVLRSWAVVDKIKSDFSLNLKAGQDIRITASGQVSWQIFRFDQAPKAWQQKYLTSLTGINWLAQAALAVIKNHWVVGIKISGPSIMSWQIKSANLAGIYFYIQGEGEITIKEEQIKPACQLVMIEVGNFIKLNYSLNKKQQTGSSVLSYHARLNKQTVCQWEVGIKNKAWLVGSFSSYLVGVGSVSNYIVGGRVLGQAKTYLNFINQHLSPHTTGDMLIKSVGEDKSQTILEGLIAIGNKSANTNSYLQEDALLLSSQARASALPNLEILNRDVKASHGATVGRIDETMLYYLTSRGLTKVLAKELILTGFFHSLGSRITDSHRQTELFNLLLAK